MKAPTKNKEEYFVKTLIINNKKLNITNFLEVILSIKN